MSYKGQKWVINNSSASNAFILQDFNLKEPNTSEIIVEVRYSGVNFADVMMFRRLYQDAPKPPFTPGYEILGNVLSCGADVHHLVPGDTVMAITRFGGYSSLVCLDVTQVVKISDTDLKPELCALATAYSTAWVAMHRLSDLLPGDSVLVPAASGGVGHGLLAFAKRAGFKAYALVSSDAKATYLHESGCEDVYVGKGVSLYRQLYSTKKRFNAVYNAEGGKTVPMGMKLLKSGGSMVCYGAAQRLNSGFQLFTDIRMMLGFGWYHPVSLLMKSQSINGLNMLRLADDRPGYLSFVLQNVFDSYSQGNLFLPAVELFSANDALMAMERMQQRSHIGKIVLEWK
jgi:2-desacetyl-2-hydroxyethyl bacteriochlorophyllide A dehydrogenase